MYRPYMCCLSYIYFLIEDLIQNVYIGKSSNVNNDFIVKNVTN